MCVSSDLLCSKNNESIHGLDWRQGLVVLAVWQDSRPASHMAVVVQQRLPLGALVALLLLVVAWHAAALEDTAVQQLKQQQQLKYQQAVDLR